VLVPNRRIARVRAAVLVLGALGIAGMIATSIAAGNGRDWGNQAALACGIVIGIAVVALLTATWVTASPEQRSPTGHFRDAEILGGQLEDQVSALIRQGVDEQALRNVVKIAHSIGRTSD